MESITKEAMSVIDIGANIGITTVAMAKRIGRGGKLCSFEPLPEYFNILKENVSSNKLENVKAYELAVTDQVGGAYVYQKGLSSGIVFEEGAKKFKVSTTTIDRFLTEEKIERIDLINMDCEGSELLVLKGAKETLQKNEVKIFCEIHHDFLKQVGQSIEDIVEYLKRLEFQVQSVSLDDLKLGNNFEKCEYVYAHNMNESRNCAYL
ncbi:MAG: FkbM family methyltransferase [Chloroflexota bacterium]|nr:FkbM family methyltransferase [Chloroflexota bacterium]